MNAAGSDATWPDVVPAEARRAKPRGWRLLVAGSLVVLWVAACGTLLVSRRARTVALGYDYAMASAEQRRLLDERRSLDLEEASLRSPLRVGVAAAERMGLRPPAPGEIRRIVATPAKGSVTP